MKISIPTPVAQVASLLRAPLYIVGGYVRNAILYGNTQHTDVDVCGAMRVEEVRQALQGRDISVTEVNPRIGTVLLKANGMAMEYTTFRQDSYAIGGVHTPKNVRFVTSLQQDALRRDFCANALYAQAENGEVIDPLGGIEDIHAKVIRCTREPSLVFAEDGLRLLRLVRFCAQLGFTPHRNTLQCACLYARQLADISAERKREELERIVMADTAYGVQDGANCGVRMLSTINLWPYLLPNVIVPQNVVLPVFPDVLVRLASLLAQCGVPIEQASTLLGQQGLRFANEQVARVSRWLRATEQPIDGIWAVTYGKELSYIIPLLSARRQQEAMVAYERVIKANVPTHHKQLPITPLELQQMGYAQQEIGEALRYLMQQSAIYYVNPNRATCLLWLKNKER